MDTTFLICLVAIIGIALLVALAGKKSHASKDFLLNNGQTSFWPLISTTVATIVGGGIVVGIVESTYASGPGYGLVVLFSTLCGMLLVYGLTPRMRQLVQGKNLYNLPDLLGHHIGRPAEYMAALTILLGTLGALAGQIMALGSIIEFMGSIHKPVAILLSIGSMAIYTSSSGFRGDIRADQVYFTSMILALGCLLYQLVAQHALQGITHLPAPLLSPLTFGGWPFLIVGVTLGGLAGIVSMDQWVRTFAAKNTPTAQSTMLISGAVITVFIGTSIAMGWAARLVLPGNLPPHEVYPRIVLLLQNPVVGSFVLANIAAVVLSTSNTLILILGTTFTRNILRHKEHSARAMQLGVIGASALAALLALTAESITGLMLNAYYLLFGLIPAIGALFLKQKLPATWLAGLMAASLLITLATMPLLKTMSFLAPTGVILLLWPLATWLHKKVKIL